MLARRCWRGADGEANAAYEYRPSNDLLVELARVDAQSPTAVLMPVDVDLKELTEGALQGR